MAITWETDWLASRPVFYHEQSGKVSHNINEVIDFHNFDFHPEGFNNYLLFGYSALEQTPIRHVKFLRHSSRLVAHEHGLLEFESFADPAQDWIGKTSHEDDVFQLLESSVRKWEQSVAGEIVLPTSGGYDSRLLSLLIQDKARIRSFTYGISRNQANSFEVVYARKLSEILGLKWEQIVLGDLHLYFDDWDKLFGISTHAHGMYHMEFYNKILPKVTGGNPFLSGIIGDAWAGSVEIAPLNSPADVKSLGYAHGLHADPTMSAMQSDNHLLEEYYETNRERLASPVWRVIEAMRFKLVLLSYLFTVPRAYGFQPWSPFLTLEIALKMLTLPTERRENRLWQKDLFRRHGLDLESMNLEVDHQNFLNHEAMRRMPLAPLDADCLKEVIKPEYVRWINAQVKNSRARDWFWKLSGIRGIRGVIYRSGIKDERMKAYGAYLTLKPIEKLLKKRDETYNRN